MPIKQNQIEDAPKTLTEGTAPTTSAGQGAYFTKDVGGVTEAHYVHDQGNQVQLTSQGVLKENITGTNLGVSGASVFSDKNGVQLRFRKLIAGTNVTITENANDVTIAASGGGGGGETNTGSNLGATGARIFSSKVGVDLQFRRVIAGSNVSVTENTNDVTIAATGEANTASNLGATGARVFGAKVGVDLQFRRIIAGANVTVTENTNDVTISASGGGGGGITDSYNNVVRYQVETTSGISAWITSSSTVHGALTWTKAASVMTITHNSHGRSIGERVIVRNTDVDLQVAVIATVPDANTFTIACASGTGSGSAGVYSLGFTFAHNAGAGSITSGTISAPANADVTLLTFQTRLTANTRSTTTYDVIVPASATNGGGANTGNDDVIIPTYSVRQDTDALTAVGATIAKNVSGNFSRFQMAALPVTATGIYITLRF